MAKRLSQETVDKIVDLYKKGMPIVEIADTLQIDKVTVHKYLNNLGVKQVSEYTSITAASRLTAHQKRDILQLYKQGAHIEDIESIVGTSRDAIYRLIRKKGLSRGVPEDKIQEAFRMYDSKQYSIDEILEKTGISRATLYRKLKQR